MEVEVKREVTYILNLAQLVRFRSGMISIPESDCASVLQMDPNPSEPSAEQSIQYVSHSESVSDKHSTINSCREANTPKSVYKNYR